MVLNVTTIGINFNVFSNTTGLNFNISNTTQGFINNIPAQANATTQGYYGLVMMLVLTIYLIWLFSDISQYGFFRYNSLRAIGIATGISVTFGTVMISIGFMTNFIHLGIFLGIYLLVLLAVYIQNPR